jgi:hypothetical protein
MASPSTDASQGPVPEKTAAEKNRAAEEKHAPGASWKADETHHLPKNRLSIVGTLLGAETTRFNCLQVFLALTLTTFLVCFCSRHR